MFSKRIHPPKTWSTLAHVEALLKSKLITTITAAQGSIKEAHCFQLDLLSSQIMLSHQSCLRISIVQTLLCKKKKKNDNCVSKLLRESKHRGNDKQKIISQSPSVMPRRPQMQMQASAWSASPPPPLRAYHSFGYLLLVAGILNQTSFYSQCYV